MTLAVADAGFSLEDFGGQRTGLIVGITHGAVSYAVEFHRSLLQDGPRQASPLHFSESVPNAPAGNGAIALHIRGPVHTLIGDEPVGAQVIDLAANLLRADYIDRCLVAGTEEWNAVVAHAYGQHDRAARRGQETDTTPPLCDGAAALVLEPEGVVARRGVSPHAVIAGWSLGRCLGTPLAEATAEVVEEAFRGTGCHASDLDHVLLPTGRHRRAAKQGVASVRGSATQPPIWLDLLPIIGNPMGASNLLQVASAALLVSAGKMNGPGLALSTGIHGTLSAVVVSRANPARMT
jgi:3-oxoacyl-[acyl-carrier-protein] synthase II